MNCGHVNTSRTELRDHACRLHDEGVKAPTIAKQLGVAKNTVYRWLDERAAEQSRKLSREAKRRRRHACKDCGATIYYTATRCHRCASTLRGREIRGTGPNQQRFIAAVQQLDNGDGARFTDIIQRINLQPNEAGPLIDRLLRYDLLVRVSRGRYKLP